MSLSARSIVSIAEFGRYLNTTITGTAAETAAEEFIDLCSGMVEEETGRRYSAQSETLYLDGSGNSVQELPFPIVSLYGDTDTEKEDSLQYRESIDDGWVNIVDSGDYAYIHITSLYPRQIELLEDYYFPEGSKNIKVIAYTGYDTVPRTVKKIVLEMSAVMWKESGQSHEGRIGLQSQSGAIGGGSGSSSFRNMWVDVWRPMLEKYRLKKSTVGVIDL